jgi:hypothetical protein
VATRDVSQLAEPSRKLARDEARAVVEKLGLLGTVRRRGVLDLLGILFSCAEAGRPKRVGVADAEREGAAAEADAMLAASIDMPMRRAARLAVENLGVVGSVRVSFTGAAVSLGNGLAAVGGR